MAQRKSLLLRLPPELVEELSRWAKDELRSLNAQIEYLLRDAMRRRRRSHDEAEADGPAEGGARNRTSEPDPAASESQDEDAV